MLIGLIGAPNKGKSTIFSALTMNDVQIADYAFTTIKPNLGVAHVPKECVETELGVKCRPRNSTCMNGIRKIPVNIVDVAGLVPGAHLGKGMGNQFLNDLAGADALIQVVDASGETDMHGERTEWADPAEEVLMVRNELVEWIAGIVARHMQQLSRNDDSVSGLHALLSGFKATYEQIRHAVASEYLTTSRINWSADECTKFASRFLDDSKPLVIAANKMDKADPKKLDWLKGRCGRDRRTSGGNRRGEPGEGYRAAKIRAEAKRACNVLHAFRNNIPEHGNSSSDYHDDIHKHNNR